MMSKPLVGLTTNMRMADTFLGSDIRFHELGEFYTEALRKRNTALVAIPPIDPEDASLVLDRVDGLLVTGGHDIDPDLYGQDNQASVDLFLHDDARDIALVREAQRRKMPVLAICRGIQVLNVALGGTLHQHILSDDHPDHPTMSDSAQTRNAYRHVVHLEPDSRLASFYGTAERKVNSLHHQAIDRLADGLRVVGTTPGGSIEAVESTDPDWPVMAVQWHPEMLETADEDPLFAEFVHDASAYARGR